jgi:hypothetical protein
MLSFLTVISNWENKMRCVPVLVGVRTRQVDGVRKVPGIDAVKVHASKLFLEFQ